MDVDEYRKMDEAESRMWWYFGLHANLIAALEARDNQRRPITLLDAGCGTGGFLTSLAATAPGISLFGLDFEPIAASFAARKSGADVRVGSINDLPYEAASFDVIVSADVLCHRSVDERLAISEFYRCLRPGGGRLLLNLPAYNWMMSAHDVAVHTSRRFTAGGIKKSLAKGGFRHIKAGYWNTFLFPLMILRRKITHTVGSSDVMLFPPVVEAAFRGVVSAETALIRRGVRLPFGGSVIVEATKE